ncbi:peptidoglycan-binding domain-containing protein [Szabonella alba]|uniref:Peptidoglycan-binding protein n=1 Tax=Szabonella alba TaxID=2804194 RepID=A0A8K0V942_9RHOB|nr:peptidoglycan-binding domain-containing protein [Szabonella alba]MBL4917618.1 peptidoglycan-binding protein [Szabonella alba]
MAFKGFASLCAAAALVVVPVQQAAADSGLVGGIVGGIIGGAIVNHANKNQRRTTTQRSTRSTASSATRTANREVQVALNYFGFPVGTPDGAIGPKSRAAISEYQATLGFVPNGQLNAFERDLLVSSYYRAQAGGAATMAQISQNPRGAKGLLIGYRDERLGVTQNAGQMAAAAQAPGAAMGFAAAGTGPVASAVPQFGATATPAASALGTGLPSFMGQGAQQASLASHCNKVSLVTNSNGGFVTQVTMTDPAFTLSEQFCLARTYAIAQGEDLVAKISGFTPQQITEQCAGLGPVLKDHVAAVSVKSREEVMQGVSGFVLGSGMAPAQLAGTAKICLGVGYVTDNMDVAIGSALVLSVLGEQGYGELPGHHLISGIGAAQRADLALPWFDMGHDAEAAGAAPVFAPGMADRAALVRLAAYSAAGRQVPGTIVPNAPIPASSGLPSFAVPGVTTPSATP